MFTGIVEETGEIVDVTDTDGGRRLRLRTTFDDLHHGQSISVSGVCLTVEEYGDDWFEVFLAAETVEKTYLGEVGVGDAVNLERALKAEGRFDGHIVQGHVDTTVEVSEIEQVGEDWFFEFSLPEAYGQYVVDKGSVTLDGISLTVADKREDAFTVAIIPTTYELTALSEKAVGDAVHLEVDVVAKYVESMLDGYR
ncbi:riboflavin synthase alpha chain [Halogranum gelatinilyticum]|uniref:Riboflavin synthase n=1 Tax=Halogranum gelatinilyticum TaxID=660521 RepID=A0A1G9PYB8_9EURY|nr:riboflavin synthase [Halogranum gelatinilyticum]SDM03744.1 riboflavin synthase alpha chain [Halogranum gelatinilyticum]